MPAFSWENPRTSVNRVCVSFDITTCLETCSIRSPPSPPSPFLYLPAFTPSAYNSRQSPRLSPLFPRGALCFAPTNWYSHLERNSCQGTINFTGGILATVQPPRVSNNRCEKEKRGNLDKERYIYRHLLIERDRDRERERRERTVEFIPCSVKQNPLGTLYATYNYCVYV